MNNILVNLRVLSLILVIALNYTGICLAQDTNPNAEEGRFVTGKVLDAHTGEPISAAQIGVVNFESSATTNAEGWFKIEIKTANDLLSVNAYGYNNLKLPVQGKDLVVAKLYPATFTNRYKSFPGLVKEEHYFSTPYSIINADVTGNLDQVSVDELYQLKFGGNMRSIKHSGVSGVGSYGYIRGLNSIYLNNQPLIILDGAIWNNIEDFSSINAGYLVNPLSNLNIGDIESISIIKDGNSVYGSKAANGIIMINTKRGDGFVTKINVNALFGVEETPRAIPTLSAEDYRIYLTDILGTTDFTRREINNLGILVDDPSQTIYNTYHNNTDWHEEVYQNGFQQGYSIDVNGGDEKALYYISVGYRSNQGIVSETSMERLNTRMNADIDLTDNLNLGVNLSYSNVDRNLVDDGVNFYTSPTYLSLIKSPLVSPYNFTLAGELTRDYADADILGIGNPSAILDKSANFSNMYQLILGAAPEWQFTPRLKLSSQFDYNLVKIQEHNFSPRNGVVDRYIEKMGVSENRVSTQKARNLSIYNDSRLQFSSKKGLIHQYDIILGWRFQRNNFELDYGEGHNTSSDDVINLSGGLDFGRTYGINDLTKSIANYVNFNYQLYSRYFLNASLSMDGSSRFGEDVDGSINIAGASFGLFPSVSAGWLVSSESFMSSVNFIDFMKLRAGYNITGNDGIEDYAGKSYFSSVRFMDRANGLVLTNLGNEELKWETTATINAGLDLHLFNERLALSADVYTSETKDVILLRELPDVSGLGYYWNNAGELTNMGFEINANLKALNVNWLQWEIGAGIGSYKNEITSLPNNESYITRVYGGEVLTTEGEPVGVFYGYKTNGVYSTESEARNANLKIPNDIGGYNSFTAGDIRFVDLNNDEIIDENDKQIIGDPNPDFYGSFSSTMNIKRLQLNALFTYSYGNDIYNYVKQQLESGADFSNQTTALLRRWTAEGQQTMQPKAVFGDPMGNSRFSDRWIEDGSYLRLKSVSVSYDVPVKEGFISGINIWASANNLWTLTDYLGVDPEVSAQKSVLFQGVDAGLIPLTKSYFVGIRMNL